MAKIEILYAKIGQNSKFLDTWELYTSKKCLEYVQCKFFLKRKDFLEIFEFFSNGGDPLVSKLSKIKILVYQKFQKQI